MPTAPTYGNDAYTGCEIAEENNAVWGTVSTAFIGIPIERESLKLVYEFAPENPEFGGIGGALSSDVVSEKVEGEISFYARINGAWFNILLAHLMGEEKKVANFWVDGTTATTNGNTHWYLPNNSQRSLQFKAFKGGATAAGSLNLFTGLMFQSCRIEFPEGGILKFTGVFTGKAMTIGAAASQPAVPTGTYLSSARFLTNANASFQVGATLAAYSLSSFTINYNRQVESDSAFLNSLSTPIQPGPRGNRQVTVDIGTLLFQDFEAAGMPSKEFRDRTFSKCRITMTTTDAVAAGKPATLLFDFPNIVWESVDNSLSGPGEIPVSYQFKAIEGATVGPAQGNMDMRIATFVKDDALPVGDGDAYYAAEVVQS